MGALTLTPDGGRCEPGEVAVPGEADCVKDYVPLLGYLFKRQSVVTNRTELAIFVTPYVVRSDEDADAVRERARKRLEEAEKKP